MDFRPDALSFGVQLSREQEETLQALAACQPPLPGMPPEAWGDVYQKILQGRQASGSFFTPPVVAEKVVRETLEPMLRHRDPSRLPLVLDPACGAGWFLFAAWRVLSDWMINWFQENNPRILEDGGLPASWRKRLLERLQGLDLDPIALLFARRGLRLLARLPRATVGVRCVDSLQTDWPLADIIVGNPPFVRVKRQNRLGRETTDLYIRFVERSLAGLETGGRAGLVVPNRLLTAQYARSLRNQIAMGRHLVAVEDCEGQQLFPGASTYVCLLWLSKDPSFMAQLRRGGTESWLESKLLLEDPWPLRTGVGAPLESRLARLPTLGTVAQIFVGVQTSADQIFHLPADTTVETALRWPLLSGRDVRPWRPPSPRQTILFPYQPTEKGVGLMPWERLCSEFPEAAAYLLRHRERLAAREGGRFADAGWYRYGRAQNLGIQQAPKVCVPRLIRRLNATLDTGSILDNVDVSGVRPRLSNWSLEALLGLFNSRLWGWYLARISVHFRGGYRSANRQFLSRLPVPHLEDDTWLTEIGLLSRLLAERWKGRLEADAEILGLQERLDRWVEDGFGLSREERELLG